MEHHNNFLLYKFIVVIYITVAGCSPYAPTLQHVNLLYRHGDRSPVYIYPKDKNQMDVWPDGLGWLSDIGKQQQYELGQYLRSRYGGFINVTRYDHRQVTIKASAVQRCLMSAYSNLAGFFPPQGDQVWNQNLLWQPIPVRSTPEIDDNKLAMGADCPRYDQLLEESYSSKKVQDFQKEYKEFFTFVSGNTGVNESIYNIWQVSDTLVCEQAHNLTWNDWVNKVGVYEKMKKITVFGWGLLFFKPEMAKLKGGPLLGEMIENMKTASANKSNELKMHIYSAHDTTVAALLNAMTVFNGQQPPYRTTVMVELHTIDGNDVVKIFYRNDTTKEPYYFVPSGCEDPCKLSTFEKLLSSHVPKNWQEECKVMHSASDSLSAASWIALSVGVGLGIIVLIALLLLIRRRKGTTYNKL